MKDSQNIHKDHRKRMREKYEKHGADFFETHQLLEMLLFHSMRQGDTNPAAHNLLNAHPKGAGSVTSSKELCDAEGIGEVSANLLRISQDTSLRILCDTLKNDGFEDEFTLKMYLWLYFRNKPAGYAVALLLDSQDRFVDCVLLAKGRTVRAENYSDLLLFEMEKAEAKKAVICHNHANNDPRPSLDDKVLTQYLENKLCEKGFELKAHYLVTDTRCVSVKTETK